MTIVAGSLSFSGNTTAESQARALAARSARYPGMRTDVLFEDARAACYAIKPARGGQASAPTSAADPGRSIVVGRVGRGSLPAGSPADVPPDGRWIAVTHLPASGTLRLACDPLGAAWLYIARTKTGYVFSSDFGALAASFPDSLSLDEDAALAHLALGYPPDDSTCFTEISILPAGSVVELRQDGIALLSRHRPAYGDRLVSASREDKFARLDELYAEAIDTWCGPDAKELVVSLSGGYDSRYGLALLHERRIAPPCVTWGHPDSHDARVSRSVCERLGLDWTLYEHPAESWAGWERCIEQGGAGGSQWGPWSEAWLGRLAEAGTTGLLGFLGDALSGKHLVSDPAHPDDWARNWEAWSFADGWAGSPLLRPAAGARLLESVRSSLGALARTADVALPHQLAMHLDLRGRQRRFTASQANLMARFLAPSLVFYTGGLLEFWGNLPYEDLRGQALYRAYARTRFPSVFGDEGPRPRPTLRQRADGTARNFLTGLFPSLRQRLLPTEIDLTQIFVRHRADLRAAFGASLARLDTLLDPGAVLRELDRFPHSHVLRTVHVLRLLNLCVLLRSSDASRGAHDSGPAGVAAAGRASARHR